MKAPAIYQLLKLQDDYEVRHYKFLFTAKVIVPGPFEKAYKIGSKLLLDYLNGNNYKQQKIKHYCFFMMLSHIEGWEVSCMLPEDFSLLSSPRPIGDYINFEELNSRDVVVHRFSGKSTYSTIMKKIENLKNWAKESNLKLSKSERIVIYHSPVLSFIRKNEIQVDRL